MQPPLDYITLNRQSWNQRTDVHLASAFYDLEGFRRGASSLNEIELALLGNLEGKSVLHLQCHFGQDSLSLARMGARVTGVDLSDKAITAAKALSSELGLAADFICCNLYDLPQHLDKSFDIVFTSYGTIGWLPDLENWAGVIAHFLKKGGQLVFVEFHPVVWMFDDGFGSVAYNYFNTGPIVEEEPGTYADRSAPIQGTYVMWNHSLAEVFGALTGKGLTVLDLQEYNYSPYNCFRHTEQVGPRRYRIQHLGDKIPMVYSLVAEKNKTAY